MRHVRQMLFADDVEIPFLESVKIKMTSPWSVDISVKEKTFFGYVEGRARAKGASSGDATVSEGISVSSDASGDGTEGSSYDGISISGDASKTASYYIEPGTICYNYFDSEGKITEQSNVLLDGYLKVNGAKNESFCVGDYLSFHKSDVIEYILKMVSILEKYDFTIDELDVGRGGSVSFSYKKITVILGSDSQNAEAKILRLKEILPMIKKKKGTIDLSDWSGTDDDIIFSQDK